MLKIDKDTELVFSLMLRYNAENKDKRVRNKDRTVTEIIYI